MSQKLNIEGSGVSITDSMTLEAGKRLSKLFKRHLPLSHSVIVKKVGPSEIEVVLNYQSFACDSITVKSSGPDFYSVLSAVRDKALSKLDKARKAKIQSGRKRAQVKTPIDVEPEFDDEF